MYVRLYRCIKGVLRVYNMICSRTFALIVLEATHTKVAELHREFLIEEAVVRFQVTVDDTTAGCIYGV